MQNICDFSYEEIVQIITKLGFEPYRALQVYEGINKGLSFAEITVLPREIITALQENYVSDGVSIISKFISGDGTIKFINKLNDNNVIESVLMKYKYGYSLCISSQVGCKNNCVFCASGKDGLIRDLTAGEMLGEVIVANAFLNGGLREKRKITNIVMMGTGEPLDNFDNVIKFLNLVSCKKGLNVSLRNISLSTCGVVPNIYKLADYNLPITLSISLHATTDQYRQKIMPIAKTYNLQSLYDSLKHYYYTTNRRIAIEYTVIDGVNNFENDAQNLVKVSKKFACHINLIALNDISKTNSENNLNREVAKRFLVKLQNLGLSATLRRTMGADISGACGQLRRKFVKGD